MTIQEWQEEVDHWIKTIGVRYFDEKTNALILAEEVGEFARIIAREYGEQSWKEEVDKTSVQQKLREEIADIFWVTTCLANQLGINLSDELKRNLAKKTQRDKERHLRNPKL